MQKPIVIVAGKNGQAGNELHDACTKFSQFDYYFFAKEELNITNDSALKNIFEKYRPSYFINTAAYTAVDKAETEREAAFLINAEGAGIIARTCNRYNTTLIHISTDYVFDGTHT